MIELVAHYIPMCTRNQVENLIRKKEPRRRERIEERREGNAAQRIAGEKENHYCKLGDQNGTEKKCGRPAGRR